MSIPPRARPAEATFATAAFPLTIAGWVEVADPPAAVETGEVLVALAVVLKRVVPVLLLVVYGVETGTDAIVLLDLTVVEEEVVALATAEEVGARTEVETPVT